MRVRSTQPSRSLWSWCSKRKRNATGCAAGPLTTGWQLCHARWRLLPRAPNGREFAKIGRRSCPAKRQPRARCFRRPPAEYSRASVGQTEGVAAAQQTCGRTGESQTEGQAGGANYDHTYLAERLRQHQPAWQPTNGYGYAYDPWHVPEPGACVCDVCHANPCACWVRPRQARPPCSRRICQPRRRRHVCCGSSHQAPS